MSGDVAAADALDGAADARVVSCYACFLTLSPSLPLPLSMQPELGRDTLLALNGRLIAAAAEGDCQAIGELLDDGAVVDWTAPGSSSSSSVGTALHLACRNGHEAAVKLLLEVEFSFRCMHLKNITFSQRCACVDVVAPGRRTPLHDVSACCCWQHSTDHYVVATGRNRRLHRHSRAAAAGGCFVFIVEFL
jgi:hypothetical protein